MPRASDELSIEWVCEHTFISNWLSPAATVVDLGVRHGEFSSFVSQRYGCHILGAEANPNNMPGIPEIDNARIRNVAITGESGPVKLHIPPIGDASLELCGGAFETVTVDGESLEDFIAELDGPIALLKMDIEGAELDVLLESSEDVLARCEQITVEFHDFIDSSMTPRVEQALARLRKIGFHVLRASLNNGDVLLVNRFRRPLSLRQRLLEFQSHRYKSGIRRRFRRFLLNRLGR